MLVFIYILIVLVLLNELVIFFVYGSFIDKNTGKFYMNLDESKIMLNFFSPSIISTQRSSISIIQVSILSKYYIHGFGTVPRWSKLHKRIQEYYIIALNNE